MKYEKNHLHVNEKAQSFLITKKKQKAMFWKFGTIGKDICKDTCKSLVFLKLKYFIS